MIHRMYGFARTIKVIEEELLRFTAALRNEGRRRKAVEEQMRAW